MLVEMLAQMLVDMLMEMGDACWAGRLEDGLVGSNRML